VFEIKRVRKTFKNLMILREMDDTCFPEDSYAPLGLRKYSWWFVYDENNKAVAYAVGCSKKDKSYFLARAGVLPEQRGQNIQQILINERVNMAKSLGLKNVITYTSINNPPSIKNLKKCGFVEWVDAPNYWKTENFISWILNIGN